jgi:hypothetical protein
MAAHRTPLSRRPRFMEQRKLTAADCDSVYHAHHAANAARPGAVWEMMGQLRLRELLNAARWKRSCVEHKIFTTESRDTVFAKRYN